MDCMDNSCRFADKISGQRTNGGCRCLPPTLEQHKRHEIVQAFQSLRSELAAEREKVTTLRSLLREARDWLRNTRDVYSDNDCGIIAHDQNCNDKEHNMVCAGCGNYICEGCKPDCQLAALLAKLEKEVGE
jgi:hypothetical protein